jgi:hypothetical protein
MLAAAMVVFVALLILPGLASAKPKYYSVAAEHIEAIPQLRGTNGFRFSLLASAKQVDVSVVKREKQHGLESVAYIGRRQGAFGKDLHISFGREGRLDLRFVVDKAKEEPPGGYCKGAPSVIEKGHYVGSIHLHGLHGFTRVDSSGAPGIVYRQGRQVCRRHKQPGNVIAVGVGSAEAKGTRLIAGKASGSPRFEAFTPEPEVEMGYEIPGETVFTGSVSEMEGGLSVTRSAVLFGIGTKTFVTPDPLDRRETATVQPPAPFTGSATFELAEPTKAEWSGSLAAQLPGLGEVPLTGPGIAAGLCQNKSCTKTLPPRLRPDPSDSEFTGSFFAERPS